MSEPRRVVFWVQEGNIGVDNVVVVVNGENKGRTNGAGFIELFVPADAHHVDLQFIKPDATELYDGFCVCSDMTMTFNRRPTPPPPTPVDPVSRLRVQGVNFIRDDGAIWKWRGLTGFTGLEDWLAKREDHLKTYLAWGRTMRRNTIRVFGMWSRTIFSPLDYMNYYTGLDTFLRFLAEQGYYLHYTAFTDQVDGSPILMSQADQDRHFRMANDVLRAHANAFGEVINEDYKNGEIAHRFAPTGGLWTRSAWVDGEPPDTSGPILNFTSEHTPRDGEWERKAKNLAETSRLGVGDFPATGKPAVAGEPTRVAEGTTTRAWADYTALSEMFGAGMTIHGGDAAVGHGSNLQRCDVPSGDALECCKAVCAVIEDGAIRPDTAGAGVYTASHLGNTVCSGDGALKSYAMIEGDRATLVRVRETSDAQLVNGWRLVERRGPNRQIYLVQR